MKRYYVIYETPNEYSAPTPVYIAETLREAESRVMDYADWYSPKGTCEIRTVDSGFKTLESRRYREGKPFETPLAKYIEEEF